MITKNFYYPLSVDLDDGSTILSSEHRELYDADDDQYNQDAVNSFTNILVSTCVGVNGGDRPDVNTLRKLFNYMATPVRDWLFYSILEMTDPGGMIVKDVQCNKCKKRFKARVVEHVPTPDDTESPGEVFSGINFIQGGDVDDSCTLNMEFALEEPSWKVIERERKFDLNRPIEISIKEKDGLKVFEITSITLRVSCGDDELKVSKHARGMSMNEVARKMRARRIVSADGIPDKYLHYVQSVGFIRRIHKIDQKTISEWDRNNSILQLWQFSTCPYCGARVPNIRDPGFFF